MSIGSEKAKATKEAKTKHLKTKEEIAKIIQANRTALGISQRELGDRTGLTSHSISLIEQAKTMAYISTLEKIALALNFSPTVFHKERPEKKPPLTAKFVEQDLDQEDGWYYYNLLLNAVEAKCLAFNGDGILKGGGTTLKEEDHGTLDCFIGEKHWFLHSIYVGGDELGVKLYDLKREEIVVDHTHPHALDVLQQLLAARWRTDPLKEDEE